MGKNILTACLALPLILIGCTKESASESKIQLLTHDFSIQQITDEDTPQSFVVDPDCNTQLSKALCVSDYDDMGIDSQCSSEKVTPAQIAALIELKDSLPPFHKKVMCSLGRVQIQKNIFSIAYATYIRNPNRRPIGTMIGFRPDVLTKENNQDLYSWKEQLNFGISDPKDPERRFDPNGPLVKEEIPQEYSHHLPTVIHELNHLIDHLNSANNVEYSSCDSTSDPHILNCKIPTDSYTHFFWNENYAALTRLEEEDDSVFDNIVLPEPEWKNQWPLLGKLCFYFCKTTQSPDNISSVYGELKKSNFATSYATQSEYEDFAEAATYYALESMGVPYKHSVYNAKGFVYFDGYEHYQSEVMKEKRDWLSNFFKKDLSYSFQ